MCDIMFCGANKISGLFSAVCAAGVFKKRGGGTLMTSNNCFGSAGFDGAGFASTEQQPGEMSSDEPPSRCIFD